MPHSHNIYILVQRYWAAMDLRVICRWFKCVGKYVSLNYVCTKMIEQTCCFAQLCLRCKACKPLLFLERLRSFANVSEVCNLNSNNVCLGYHGWSNFHNWTRMLCIAILTKLFALNMFAHEANVTKPKLWTNFLGYANLIKQNILLVAANVVKSQVLNKVAWAANLIRLLLLYNVSLR